MLKSTKRVGETPLEFLERLREENPELKEEKLSYAGRLDPMAEGEMFVMIGEENNDREKHLGYDKEYIATFLFGVSTDSGDALGFITNSLDDIGEISLREISPIVEDFKKIETQIYPWFSSKTVAGVKLFEHFKSGNTQIDRPSREVEIKSTEILNYYEVPTIEVQDYIFQSIKKVNGNFRQKETLEKWTEFFKNYHQQNMVTLEVKILVSSGTYIRGLTENFPIPTLLLKLNRTKIISGL